MAFRALAIMERAYRGSVETQFVDMLYFARELNRQFGRLDIALRGAAVTFAVDNTVRPCVTLGSRLVDSLPDSPNSLRTLMDEGVTVSVDARDLEAVGISSERLLPGVQCDGPAELAGRWGDYDGVWFI